MRRLGGSRWCLRRTRGTMGFERQFGVWQVYGQAPEKQVEIVCASSEMKECRGKVVKGAVGMVWAHEGIGVPEHIPAMSLMEVLGRIEVHAC